MGAIPKSPQLKLRRGVCSANWYIRTMNCGKKSCAFLLSGLLLSTTAQALTPDSGSYPYSGITNRNVFSLKPPTPVEQPKPPPPPVSKITLTGITTIFGKKMALMTAQAPARPPEPAKQESYMLAEGERDKELEVISIDEKAGVVKVNNGSNVETLDFVNNGAKLVSAPPPMAGGSPGGIPQPGMPGAAGAPGILSPGPVANGMRTMRSPRSPNGPGATTDPSAAANSYGVNYGAQSQTTPIQIPQMTPEEQTIMIEVERERTKDDVMNGVVPPPPLTDLTPDGAPGTLLTQ
jgi:hypothetical protein